MTDKDDIKKIPSIDEARESTEGPDLDDETVRDYLRDGVWERSIQEWRDESNLDGDDTELVEELGLIEEFEFFWDADFDRVGYEAPSIPKDWKSEDYADEVKSWGQVSKINMAMSELGEKAREIIETEKLDLRDE
ncbi:MAG: hypothetical protein ABEK59_08895 [Halobacteria archaeon]